MRPHRPPFILKEIKVEVTHACNLCCVHCSSMATAQSKRHMSWDDCRGILEEAALMDVKEVAFSGGEPLIWDRIEDAVTLASQRGMHTCLYTSGCAPGAEKLMRGLRDSSLNRVVFSVFGVSCAHHEAVTSVKGSYDLTMRMVECAVGLGLKAEFHFVPTSVNYHDLEEIADQAQKLGVTRVSVLRLVPQGRAANTPDMQLSRKQNLRLRESILRLRSEGHDIRVGSPYNFLMLRDKPECCSGIDRLTIGPDLRIFPCDAFKHIPPERLGLGPEYSNLQDHTLAECWQHSPYLRVVRQYLTTDFAAACAKCDCLEECLSGCMAQKFHANGDLRKCPDPMCLKGEFRRASEAVSSGMDGHG